MNEEIRIIGKDGSDLFRKFLDILEQKTGVNFHNYKPTTLSRRIIRRMHLLNIESADEYLVYLQNHELEHHQLFRQLLIHVTSFFRDEPHFDYLCSEIIPRILAEKTENNTVRIWVCGCATGEEAYSIAICLFEHFSELYDLGRVKIFASDLSAAAIDKARRAIYSPASTANVSEQRLERFFNSHAGGWQVKNFIRDMCVFVHHNVLADPPFANIDLVSCRNVLIYMQPVLQKKILSIFSYALRPNAYLFLGKSETGTGEGHFEAVNKTFNFYINSHRNRKLSHVGPKPAQTDREMINLDKRNVFDKKDFQKAADDILLARYIPAGVVINENFDIVDFRGNTGFYIEPSPGIASFNILKMVRKGLYYDLQECLQKVKGERSYTKCEGIALEHEGKLLRITIEIQPLSNTKERFYLVLFQNVTPPEPPTLGPDDGINNTRDLRIHQLEQELMESREQLRALSEQQEATSEEFQSANEELKALNEELQTSQEELISTNEELTIRNKELNQVNRELNAAREYADAINNTVNDSLVVLDKSLRVKSANASYYATFQTNSRETDGRLLYELGNGQWNLPELRRMLEQAVLEKKELENFEVTLDFYLLGSRTMKLNARKMLDDTDEEGLILLMIEDITAVKAAERHLEETIARLDFAMNAGSIGSWEISLPDKQFTASATSKVNLGQPPDAELTYAKFQEIVVAADRALVSKAMDIAIATHGLYNEEFRIEWPDGTWHWINAIGKALYNDEGVPVSMIGVIADITIRKDLEQKLRYSEQHFRTLSNSAPVMIAMSGPSGVFNFYNEDWLRYTGKEESSVYSDNYWFDDIHPEDVGAFMELQNSALTSRKRFNAEFRLRHKGNYRWMSCNAIPRFELDNTFSGYTMACMDIHDQKMTNETLERLVSERTVELSDVNELLLDRNRELEQFAFVTSHDLQEPLRKIRMFISMLLDRSEGQNSEINDYLRKIEGSAGRMTGLIQDLLNYSSLQEKSREFVPTDLNQILQTVLADFDLLMQEKGSSINVDTLPLIEAVPLQMRQLFYNLISNALKFSQPGRNPEIAIQSRLLTDGEVEERGLHNGTGWHLITVSDNGVGFSQSYAEKIFVLFERLHDRKKFKGNGIGLALCKRIVANHDGFISANSIEGEGTVFEVVIPLKQISANA
ncbi:CheR family methyltransferase [uncultured Chitinophaga sp.]|uniref:CheR family methyltransferase n=1 Tax=uncultured Chitinophaga sp. TaxID=339340 RepID=UPI0025CE9D4D|nr:CheR family methyltransferase [uncultured Chitinophaga sp.]